MTERDLLNLWNKARQQIVLSQLAPTFLLIVTIGLMTQGLADANVTVKFAALGILGASGILGALVQYTSATEALSISAELKKLDRSSSLAHNVISSARWMNVVRFVTPAIFVLIFVLIALALLGPSA